MQSGFKYARMFEKDWVVIFVDEYVLNIVHDMMSSNFFAANSKATYVG